MIGITIMIIIAFGGWGIYRGKSSPRNVASSGFRIYGRVYTLEELQKQGNGFSVARYAGLGELLNGLCGTATSQDLAFNDFIFNRLILNHEAQRLGIIVDDGEVAAAIAKLPNFQTNDAFDHAKYQLFLQTVLPPHGFTTERFEDLVRDEVRLQKIVALLGSTVDLTPAEFRSQYVQINQKMRISVVRLDLKTFKAAIQPTEEEIARVFKDREKSYTSPEKRVVSFVTFDLSEADKALKGKENMTARQNLANHVGEFGDLLKENHPFADVAKKYGLEIKTTPEFAEAEPPSNLASVPNAAAVSFKLNENESTIPALPMGDGYCILHLDKITPSRQLTLAEARPQVIEQIKAERANEMLTTSGNALRAKIAEALKAGKSLADAAKEAGQQVETFPAFSLTKPPVEKPDAQTIIMKAVQMSDGDLSDYVPVAEGGVIIHLDGRDPIDEEQFKKDEKEEIAGARKGQIFAAFTEWIQARRKSANVQPVGQQQRQGAPE